MSIPRSIPLLFLLLTISVAAEYSRVDIAVSERGSTGTMHLFLFDSRLAALKIIDQGGLEDQPHKNLEHAMRAHHCLAGCNGGFFAGNGQPVGLAMADGKVAGRKDLSSGRTEGILGQGTGQPFLERSESYFTKGPQSHRQLLQTGPFLVEKGKAAADLDTQKHARRTVIFTDGKHQWGIAYVPAITLAQLAKALADPATFPSFQVHAALNLNGGSSSGLWVHRPNHPFYLRELGAVRNFVGVVKK